MQLAVVERKWTIYFTAYLRAAIILLMLMLSHDEKLSHDKKEIHIYTYICVFLVLPLTQRHMACAYAYMPGRSVNWIEVGIELPKTAWPRKLKTAVAYLVRTWAGLAHDDSLICLEFLMNQVHEV